MPEMTEEIKRNMETAKAILPQVVNILENYPEVIGAILESLKLKDKETLIKLASAPELKGKFPELTTLANYLGLNIPEENKVT